MKTKKILAALLSGTLTFSAMTAVIQQNGLLGDSSATITAEAATTLRRPCDPEHPMLIVHTDTWNVADPAKVIQAIPEDIRPLQHCRFAEQGALCPAGG